MMNPIDSPHRPGDNPRSNYVPANAPTAAGLGKIEPMPGTGYDENDPNAAGQTVSMIKTSYVDRAWAFSIRTHQLAGVVSVSFLIAALFLGASGAKILLLVGTVGYLIVWSIAFWLDVRTSPGGVARHHSTQAWREIRRVNSARVDAFRRANGIEKKSLLQRILKL